MIWVLDPTNTFNGVPQRRLWDACGFIPSFLSEEDPRPAREQIDERYEHGGGFVPLRGGKIVDKMWTYPGDPPMAPIASLTLHGGAETIYIYPAAFVAIVASDGTATMTRLD